MEMSIDESLEWLISRKEHYEMDDNCQELAQALECAISVLRKYQKIQEIMKSKKMDALNIGLLIPKDMACILHEIKEVIEDGKNT